MGVKMPVFCYSGSSCNELNLSAALRGHMQTVAHLTSEMSEMQLNEKQNIKLAAINNKELFK